LTTLAIKGIPLANVDFYEKDHAMDISAKKREAKTDEN